MSSHEAILGWLEAHEQKDMEMFREIKEKLDDLNTKLEPISDLYRNMSFTSKTFLGIASGVAFIVGLVLSIKELIK